MRSRNLWAGFIVAVATTGCAEFRAPTTWFDKPLPTETVRNPVQRLVTVWQATEGPGLEGLPGRGFAGQILFFPHYGETPVKIEGDVRIYVFDDNGSIEDQAKPLHQFDFPDGSLNEQLVPGSLGPTYQVFIPYTRKGPQEAKCSLRMRYIPKVGNTVYSEVVQVTLPGSQRPRGDAIVAVPQRSVPRVSTGDDIDTFRLDRSRHEVGRFDAIRRASAEEPSRFADASATAAGRSDVEASQAARIAELERRLAEQLGGTVTQASHRIPEDDRRDSFVDRSESSSPVRESAFDRDQPRYKPLGFSRPAVPTRDFGADDERFAPRNANDDQTAGRPVPAEPAGHPFAPEPAKGPSIEAAGTAYQHRESYDGRSTATSGASPQKRFRLTGRPQAESSDRVDGRGVRFGAGSLDGRSAELDRSFSLDSEAWNGDDEDAGSREIR
jgi:hypothetical protein